MGTLKYSQNFLSSSILTGIHRVAGVTRGILVILTPKKPKGGGKPSSKIFSPEEWIQKTDEIQTQYIWVPEEESEIKVDVLLLNNGDDPESVVAAALESKKYREVRVYSIDEVTLYDRNPND